MIVTPNLLNSVRLPARLESEQAAVVLGFKPEHISILMKAGLLKPLGRPTQNATKHFAAAEILAKGEDRDFLDKAERALSAHWTVKNSRTKQEPVNAGLN